MAGDRNAQKILRRNVHQMPPRPAFSLRHCLSNHLSGKRDVSFAATVSDRCSFLGNSITLQFDVCARKIGGIDRTEEYQLGERYGGVISMPLSRPLVFSPSYSASFSSPRLTDFPTLLRSTMTTKMDTARPVSRTGWRAVRPREAVQCEGDC